MGYKTLLTVVTDAAAIEKTLDAAVALAARHDAHLDILSLGIDRTQVGYYYAGASAVILQDTIERAQADADALDEVVKTYMGRQDVRWSSEAAVAQLGGLGSLVALRARFSDLVVLPRPYGEGRGQENEAVVEAAMFEGQAPVMVLPETGLPATLGKRIVIAWNQSSESLTAIRRALPLLKKAELVNIVVIDPPQHGPERSDPGGQLSQMLSRHGVRAEVSVLAKTMPHVSEVLARHIRDQNADMLVMGAYGHSRFREAILGGATRDMLELAEVPVFMAH
jgi:nucleotide-binding universal stress UspA family protein